MLRLLATVLLLCLCGAASGVGAGQQNGPRQVSLVVTGGTVVTVDGAHRVIPRGAVAIDGTDIVAVDTADAIAKQFKGSQTIASQALDIGQSTFSFMVTADREALPDPTPYIESLDRSIAEHVEAARAGALAA